METVLITGARALIALEIARSFFKQGHRVIMADSLSMPIARWSNCVHQYYKIPSPRYAIDKYVEAIQQIIDKENVSHIIPTCEEAIYVASQKNRFNCKVWTSDINTVLKLHNKYSFYKCYIKQLPIPKTIRIDIFNNWFNTNDYVFKPIYSRFASTVIIDKTIKPDFFSENEKSKWIAQKKIAGLEICVFSIWDNGKLKAYAAYHPLFRAGKGAGVFFEPVNNEQVMKHVQCFGESLKYTGQLSFDVIIDKNDNPYFIECNPRGTSGAHLINTELATAFLGDKLIVPDTKNNYAIKYAMAILHPLSFFKKQNRKAIDVVYTRKDKKPFYLQIMSLWEITYIKFAKRVTWLQATTNDIEWNGNEN